MTMENFRELPLEVRLSAYLDGQVDPEDARELEALLEKDVHARDLLNTLSAGSDFGNQAFDELLKEPVPLSMVRAIRDTSAKPPPVQMASNTNTISFFRFVPQAIAASAVLLLAGGYSGYFVGKKSAAEMPLEISETTAFEAPGAVKTRGFSFDTPIMVAPVGAPLISANDVADIHDVYSKQSDRLAEIPASNANALISWLSASTGINFSIPDLSADGLRFEGGRLIALDGKPAGALFYKNAAGEVVGVYYVKGTTTDALKTEGAHTIVSGSKGQTAWFVAAPVTSASLADIAGKASAAL
ncbi:anti-sigma factor [Rhizobium sp. KVB221]|uniref:Anti-sigma factor n=1 Tax=Rhizobium setariae TaxID=2801340 RepID=A0A936YT99_9HYPH|nr:anti-sigma factor [Rhizobium setariae]MBL0372030.1 anti-sigma factor [Rhizobium setariae]